MRAMHPAARAGYLYLLTCQWQSDDCSISSDALDLAEMSELGDEIWAQYGPRIIRKFDVLPDGRLRNRECFAEWQEAKRVFESRRQAANRTNTARSPHATATVTARGPLRSADTITGTVTGTETVTSTGTGEPSQPAPSYDFSAEEEANIPDDLPSPVLGNFILQRLSIPHSHGLSLKFASCVDLLARDEGHPRGEAARLLIHRGRDHPPDNGKWRFWLEDGSWKEREGISTVGWE